jgi:protoporphyrinogen oxidase
MNSSNPINPTNPVMEPVIIIGAGPAGLGAAHELVKQGIHPIVLEKGNSVGGLARTETYKGYFFDVGGHRFFTKNREVEKRWQEMLGEDLIKVARLSRIYYQDTFFNYPLNLFNALFNMGPIESTLILLSYLRSHFRPYPQEDTFEQWVSNRFGHRLYRSFFKTYTEKVWGIPCNEIRAEWAAQRIRGVSLVAAAANALLGLQKAKSLTSEFYYPLRGPGMMWKRFREMLETGGAQVHLNAETVGVTHENGRISRLRYVDGGKEVEVPLSHLISSMPITKLVALLDPKPSDDVLEAARQLHYRAFVTVGLIVDKKDLFLDQWIYIHSPQVKVGRIQNFKNWSSAMVPDSRKTNVGMEYFCNEDEDLWNLPDRELATMASKELSELGFCATEDVVDSFVIRQPMAYPVYDNGYTAALKVLRDNLGKFENLYTVGRNGMHRYNNMDHSMLTGILAARNVLGARQNLWEVNEEESYLEEEKTRAKLFLSEKLFLGTFARIDKLAFAIGVGSVLGLIVFLATIWPVLMGGDNLKPILSLLNQYFVGYTVSVKGAFIAFGYSLFWGFLFGWLLAYVRNFFIAFFIYRAKKKAEDLSIQDLLDAH